MTYKSRAPKAHTDTYAYASAPEHMADARVKAEFRSKVLSGRRLPPGMALLVMVTISLAIWAMFFALIHFLTR